MHSPSLLSLLVSKYQSSYRERKPQDTYHDPFNVIKKYQSNFSSYRLYNPVNNNNNNGDAHNTTYFIFIRITEFLLFIITVVIMHF